MSDVVLVDLNERETWALLTMLSYMQRAGYRLAPNLIEDYANNILENSSSSEPVSQKHSAKSSTASRPIPSPAPSRSHDESESCSPTSMSSTESYVSASSSISSADSIPEPSQDGQSIQERDVLIKVHRKVNPSFIANLLLEHPDNIYYPPASPSTLASRCMNDSSSASHITNTDTAASSSGGGINACSSDGACTCNGNETSLTEPSNIQSLISPSRPATPITREAKGPGPALDSNSGNIRGSTNVSPPSSSSLSALITNSTSVPSAASVASPAYPTPLGSCTILTRQLSSSEVNGMVTTVDTRL